MSRVAVLREVDPSARVAAGASVGEFCVVGPGVTIGPGTVLGRRVTVTGHTVIGRGNAFEEGCVVGGPPQDLKYRGGPTVLAVGDRNRFGRNVTVHVGTEPGGHLTRIGDDNAFGDGCHVAHDCFVDDRVRLGARVMLAGHVRVETGAVTGDMAAAHHFVTVGRFSRVAPRTAVRRDVPPYTEFGSPDPHLAPARVTGVHQAGIDAADLPAARRWDLRRALRELFADESALQTKIEHLFYLGIDGEAADLCRFCLRSLQGVYGRHRERHRGEPPPEAVEYFANHPQPPSWRTS